MDNNNPLLCDAQTGVCDIPSRDAKHDRVVEEKNENTKQKVKLLYFTDPICSACWGIEPHLRKLKMEYGNTFYIEYRMGGLLPSWTNYNGGGISNPADVAHHWDEMSTYFEMPIDGNVWLEDPLASSYPPSIALKAAQQQDHDALPRLMRLMREMLFIEKKNIAKWENIEAAALLCNLDIDRLKYDYDINAKKLFEIDLAISREWYVRGFPTIFFINSNDEQALVYGVNPYQVYEQALLKLQPKAIKQTYNEDASALLETFGSLTAKELSVLAGISINDAEKELAKLEQQQKALDIKTPKGSLWRLC